MSNFEQAISDWRRGLGAHGVRSPEVLDELESHLREDFEQHRGCGVEAQEAFGRAVQRIGDGDLLKVEFGKVGGQAGQQMKSALFILAGIPNSTLATNMNTTQQHIEPWWATYLKGAAFALPALLVWALSVVFLLPKLQQICADAGGDPLPRPINMLMFVTEHGLIIGIAVMLMLIVLEWRSSKWPRYRRATVGLGTFIVNVAVLISIFLMVVTAIVAAPALARRDKAPIHSR